MRRIGRGRGMRIGQGAGILLAVMAGAGAPRAQEIVDPTWATIPDGAAMADAYPEFASMVLLEGDVNLGCRVAPDGTLSLCRVNTAVPAGLGFDRAALSLTPRFRVNPRQVDGETAKSSVRFTIRFRMEPEETPLPWRGAEPSPEHLAAVAAVVKDRLATESEVDLETLDLQVDPDLEDRLRAIVLQVDREMRDQREQAAVLAFARLLSPAQLADIEAGRPWPPRPSDSALKSAGDVAKQVSDKTQDRLRQLYCAEFECLERIPTPVI